MDGRFLQGTFNGKLKLNDERPDVSCGGEGGVSTLRSLDDDITVGLADGSVRTINAKKLSFRPGHTRLTRPTAIRSARIGDKEPAHVSKRFCQTAYCVRGSYSFLGFLHQCFNFAFQFLAAVARRTGSEPRPWRR